MREISLPVSKCHLVIARGSKWWPDIAMRGYGKDLNMVAEESTVVGTIIRQ
jgi:hypothetical protein